MSTAGLPTTLSGLTSRSNAYVSASGTGIPNGPISRIRPNSVAIRFSLIMSSRVTTTGGSVSGTVGAVGPPLVTMTVSLPSTVIPCGPIPPPPVALFA